LGAIWHVSHLGSNLRISLGSGYNVLEEDTAPILMIKESLSYPEDRGSRLLLNHMTSHPTRPMILIYIYITWHLPGGTKKTQKP
jgi:hypothetical protein